jgi:hypothetical protein
MKIHKFIFVKPVSIAVLRWCKITLEFTSISRDYSRDERFSLLDFILYLYVVSSTSTNDFILKLIKGQICIVCMSIKKNLPVKLLEVIAGKTEPAGCQLSEKICP